MGLDLNFAKQKILDNWNEVVGKQISSISQPDHFKFQTLFVNVSDSNWLHELVFFEEKIIEKINKYTGKKLVQKIYFRVSDFAYKVTKKTISNEDVAVGFLDLTNSNDEKEVDLTMKSLGDPELKKVLKRIMMKGRGVDKFRHQQRKEGSCAKRE